MIVKYYFNASDMYRKLINGLMKDVVLVEQTNNDQPHFLRRKEGRNNERVD